ncbi:MAG: dihydropteroate synthase [Desulfobacterales bacterium]|nr:dihydropteroate synthase [Desulfobacterales bacterium]
MIIIGEKINASLAGIKTIIEKRDEAGLLELATTQSSAGAGFIDVNVGTGLGSREDEILWMQWAIKTIQEQVDTPICIDSADPTVLEAGLRIRNGRPSLINSTKAEEKSLAQVLPLASQYESSLVGLAVDEAGIPKTVEGRLRACEKIAAACQKHGVSLENVYFDPLVLPVSTDVKQGLVTLNTIVEIKKQFPEAKTAMGLSNVSYGLPGRSRLNIAFLHMAICAGLDAAILDPLDETLMAAVKTAEVLTGRDRHCRRYTRAFRKCVELERGDER